MSNWTKDGGWQRDADSSVVYRWQDLRKAGIAVLADPSKLVDWFDDFLGPNPYSALSNYFRGAPISLWEFDFATGEHAFQAAKASTRSGFDKVRREPDTDRAKWLGSGVRLRPDWEEVKPAVMRAILAAKFAPGRKEAKVLLGTGSAALVEGTLWSDTFWGVDLELPRRPGKNHLGKLLTKRRSELRAGGAPAPRPPPLFWR